jgi:uncharacterized protein YndB with AHSA1/START domain
MKEGWNQTIERLDVFVSNSTEETADRVIIITRLFDAPPELLFKAWTDPRHMPRWWGPTGFTTTIHEADLRPGGVWRFTMHGPDGVNYPNRMVFEESIKPERLVYSQGGKEGAPADFHVTVTFIPEGTKTRLTMRSVFPTLAARDFVVKKYHAVEGGNQTLDRLTEHVKTMIVSGDQS